MKLYGYYRSSASYRIRIVLNAKNIAWEYVAVRLDKGEQLAAEHNARNPLKLVPVLDTGDAMLAQSVAIAEYLENLHPEPALLPANELARAQVREMQHIISSEVQPLCNLRVLKHIRNEYDLDDASVTEWAHLWMRRGFDAFEQRAQEHSTDGRFSFGDSLSLADAWLMPQIYNAERFAMVLDAYPTIQGIVSHLSTIDPIASAHPAKQPDSPA